MKGKLRRFVVTSLWLLMSSAHASTETTWERSTVILQADGQREVRQFTGNEPTELTIGPRTLASARVLDDAPSGLNVDAQSQSGRSFVDLSTQQQFRFSEEYIGQLATLVFSASGGVLVNAPTGRAQLGFGVILRDPEGKELLNQLVTQEQLGTGSKSVALDLGPASFVIERGTYALDLSGLALANVDTSSTTPRYARGFLFVSRGLSISPVPEPSAWLMACLGSGLLVVARLRKRALRRPPIAALD